MPSVDELERLSRYHAGELSAEERAAVERELVARPDLREGLEVLKSLDGAAAALPPTLEGAALDALIAGVARPAPVTHTVRRNRFTAAALILVIAAAAYAFTKPSPHPLALAWGDGVTVDGVAFQSRALRPLADGAKVKTHGAAAQLIDSSGAAWLPPEAEAAWRDRSVELLAGTMMVTGDGVELRGVGGSAKIFGVAVASVEPASGLVRVNEALSTTTPEDLVKSNWLKLPSTLALASGLTLFVVEGHAEARSGSSVVTVEAGQKWQPGAAPTAFAAAPAPAQKQAVVAATGGDSQRTREQLLAEIDSLRNEKEALLREREQLKQQTAERPHQNYYRFEQSELLDSAKKGELRLRGSLMEEEPFVITDELAKKSGLSAGEKDKLNAIMRESSARAHQGVEKLYVEMGGDANVAGTLSMVALVNEIRVKSLKDDYPNAIRQLANERAGLQPAGDPAHGSIVLRTFRFLMDEDPKVLDAFDSVLGPRRAEALVNGENFGHSNHTFGVGPVDAKKH